MAQRMIEWPDFNLRTAHSPRQGGERRSTGNTGGAEIEGTEGGDTVQAQLTGEF